MAFYNRTIILIFCIISIINYQLKGATITEVKIAYVNLEKVFNEYNLTKEVREQLVEKIKQNQEEISILEKEIQELEIKLPQILEDEEFLKQANLIIQKKTTFQELIEERDNTLKKLEETERMKIMNDIYEELEKIADSNNLTIILDKENVLWTKDALDLTEILIERLNQNLLNK